MQVAVDILAPAGDVKNKVWLLVYMHIDLGFCLGNNNHSLIQVTIADVDGDQQLEMLLADSSGTVACVKHDGTECWNRRLEGAVRCGAVRKESVNPQIA